MVICLAERIWLTLDIAWNSMAFYSMRRGYDLSFTMGLHTVRLTASKGLIFNFQFGKTLRSSSEAMVVLADRDCPGIRVFRAVTACISASQRIEWPLSTGHRFPVVTAEGGRGRLSFSAADTTANGRPAERLHNALLSSGTPDQQIPGRDSCGRQHENWRLEDRVSCDELHQGYSEWTSAG